MSISISESFRHYFDVFSLFAPILTHIDCLINRIFANKLKKNAIFSHENRHFFFL